MPQVSLFFLFLALLPFYGNSQNKAVIQSEFYSVEQGLASREVFCGVQDKDGFLWFGTRNGLNRFDGKQFKLLTRQNSALAHNRIYHLVCDQKNQLYILYGNNGLANGVIGVDVMNLTTGKMKSLREIYPNLPFDERKVYWVNEAGDDLAFMTSWPFELWILHKGEFKRRYEFKSWNEWAKIENKPFASQGAYYTTTGRHCAFAQNTYAVFITDERPFYFLTPHGDYEITPKQGSGVIKIVSEQEVLIRNKTHISSFQTKPEVSKELQLLHAGLEDIPGHIFMRRNEGGELIAYSQKLGLKLYRKGKWYQIELPKDIAVTFSEAIYSLLHDNQNNYWICTSKGLIKVHFSDASFEHYFTKEQLHSNQENQVRGIYRDQEGTLFASVWDKLYIQRGHEFRYEQTAKKDLIYGVHEQGNKIYVGNYHISCLSKDKGKFQDTIQRLEIGEIWDMDSIDAHTLLASGSHAVCRYNVVTHQLVSLKHQASIPKPIYGYRILMHPSGRKYIVAQNGLYEINKNQDSLISYYGKQLCVEHNVKTTRKPFPFETIYDAWFNAQGNCWFCTGGEGLWFWDKKKNTYKQFSFLDGLPSDILYRIEPDAKGRLWISSDNGIICFNPETGTSMIFTTQTGLSHNEFNRASSFLDNKGMIYFGSINGINAFHPDSLLNSQRQVELPIKVISYSKYSSKENAWVDRTHELQHQAIIELETGDRLINLEFQLLDYNNKLPVYAYRIEGLDSNWVYTKDNHLSLSGLPYGYHKLVVKGQMSNGLWSKKELQIQLHVQKPIYLKWWFLSALCVVVALLFWALLRWRTKNLQSSKDKLELEVRNRTYALQQALEQEQTLLKDKEVLLKEIHHRVKNNLQVISGLLELQEKNLVDDNAKRALLEGRNRVRSVALIHQNLYQFENLSCIELNSFVNELYKQVWQVYEQHTKPFQLHNHIPFIEVDIDTAVPLGLILNELLNNSFKYAGIHDENSIHITLHELENGEAIGKKFELVYVDSGPGITDGKTVKERKSLGLRLIADLSKQIGGNMNYTREQGSKFIIQFLDKEARKNRE